MAATVQRVPTAADDEPVMLTAEVRVITSDRNDLWARFAHLICVRKGATFAELRTLLEQDMLMSPSDRFVVDGGIAGMSYEHMKWSNLVRHSTLWSPTALTLYATQEDPSRREVVYVIRGRLLTSLEAVSLVYYI